MLAVVNAAAVNTSVQASFSIIIFSGYMPSSGLVRSCGSFIPSFLRNCWRNSGQFDLSFGHW